MQKRARPHAISSRADASYHALSRKADDIDCPSHRYERLRDLWPSMEKRQLDGSSIESAWTHCSSDHDRSKYAMVSGRAGQCEGSSTAKDSDPANTATHAAAPQ